MDASSGIGGGGDLNDKTIFGVSTKTLVIGGAVVATLGAGFLAYKLLFARPGFVPYETTQEGGVIRLLPYLSTVRVPVLAQCFDERTWQKMLAQANEGDDYDKYLYLMQDMLLFQMLQEDMSSCVGLIEAQLDVIQPRVFKNGAKAGYDLEAKELIDYIKWGCNAMTIYQQAGQEHKARDLASQLLEIDYAIAAAREKAGDNAGPSHLPRVLYGAQQYVLTQLDAHSKGTATAGGLPVDPDAISAIMLKTKDYADKYLPASYKDHSPDELRYLLGLYGALSEYYDSIGSKGVELEVLNKLIDVLAEVGAQNSIDAFFTRKKITNILLAKGQIDPAAVQLEACLDGLLDLCGPVNETTSAREEQEALEMLFDVYFGLLFISNGHDTPECQRISAKINQVTPLLQGKYPGLYQTFVTAIQRQQMQAASHGLAGTGDM